MIRREFDGFGLGIEDHDTIIPAWSRTVRLISLTAGLSVFGLYFYFDLQAIQSSPQAKTDAADCGSPCFGQSLLGFK
jgi:hypothetical protein